MSKQRETDALERLYEQQGAVEPPPGLDRMIRAQAEQAIEKQRRVRPLPWMGGLATAAVLVLAITVVIQTPEPAPSLPMPESFAPPPLDQAADSASVSNAERSTAAPAAPPQGDRVQVTGSRLRASEIAGRDEVMAESEPRTARQSSDRALQTAPATATAESAAFSPELERVSPLAEPAPPENAREEEVLADAIVEPESFTIDDLSPWEQLEAAIEEGEIEVASALLEALREQFPDDDRLAEFERRIDALDPSP